MLREVFLRPRLKIEWRTFQHIECVTGAIDDPFSLKSASYAVTDCHMDRVKTMNDELDLLHKSKSRERFHVIDSSDQTETKSKTLFPVSITLA